MPDGGLGGPDFRCHLELEVPNKDYGFHVYFEEMNLVGNEKIGDNDDKDDDNEKCSTDFVQFARDDLIFTTYKSDRFCGAMRKIDHEKEETLER